MSGSLSGDAGGLQYDNDFWRFSLAVYSHADVAAECLALQQETGADVNVLLFCAWTGASGIVLSGSDIEAASKCVAGWQEHVVRPLRSARQNMKVSDYRDFESFRTRLKNMEIEAEQIEQAMLFAFSQGFKESDLNPRDVIADNTDNYFQIVRRPEGLKSSAPRLIEAALRVR